MVGFRRRRPQKKVWIPRSAPVYNKPIICPTRHSNVSLQQQYAASLRRSRPKSCRSYTAIARSRDLRRALVSFLDSSCRKVFAVSHRRTLLRPPVLAWAAVASKRCCSQGALQAHRQRSDPQEEQVPGERRVDLLGGEGRQCTAPLPPTGIMCTSHRVGKLVVNVGHECAAAAAVV